jgi:long-chain acyl-CoA synthetase
MVRVPDPRLGEAVKVYIVLRDGETATAQEIIDYCRTRMARYKVPKQVAFRAELQRSQIGKVLRRQLLPEELDARAAAAAANDASRRAS